VSTDTTTPAPVATRRAPSPETADTPLMRQYLEIKARHPDEILLFHLGDFYEMFYEDAVVASRALELTLTSRDKGKEDPVPMCGVPVHSARHHVARLLELGFRVALCEQLCDPSELKAGQKIVPRGVTEVVTPGVLVDLEHLPRDAPNYLAAVAPGAAGRLGLALYDASTGELVATTVAGPAELHAELSRAAPKEVLVPDAVTAALTRPAGAADGAACADGASAATSAAVTQRTSSLRVEPPLFDALPDGVPPELAAAGLSGPAQTAAAAALAYARRMRPGSRLPPLQVRAYLVAEHLVLDEVTQRNLELFRGNASRSRKGSLLATVDATTTAMGARRLRRWLTYPLAQVEPIRRRHDAVEWLYERPALRQNLQDALDEVYDLERLAARAALKLSLPRELDQLRRTLGCLPRLAALLAERRAGDLEEMAGRPALLGIDVNGDLGADLCDRLAATLADEPPATLDDGGVIRPGFNAELDRLSELSRGGKTALVELETRERARTGISSLKVRYNRVFGYYIEVTRSNLKSVPADYRRRQTLAGAERYSTPELERLESEVQSADDRRLALERELYDALRTELAAAASRLGHLADRVADLDCALGLASVAHKKGYIRPVVDDSTGIELHGSRHPVVEELAAQGAGFVPNDMEVTGPAAAGAARGGEGGQLLVLTGPNMAGKSTLMRQVALTVILAQAGSFVPAARARIGLCDRVFTRVGAQDNLAGGESTFMVEMRETAEILAQAGPRSLILLDEIGRGTSTYDGLSIAWAVAEHVHDAVRARTLFATHYHELALLAEVRPRVVNLHFAVREHRGEIVFLRKLIAGAASRSYGIEVARLAGLPKRVLDRARTVLGLLEAGQLPQGGAAGTASPQLGLFGARPQAAPPPPASPVEPPAPAPDRLREALAAMEIDRMTPLEALNRLAELKRLA
jgi:DNA mismatch repair protein MutS